MTADQVEILKYNNVISGEHPTLKDLNIIGITGTNGKTTTTQIVDHIIKSNNKTSSSLGTLGFNTPSI